MASPFRAFRKHQRIIVALAGVVLMFVFVIADPLMQYFGSSGSSGGRGGRRGANEVAVTWNGGKLTNAELSQLVFQRSIVNAFLQQVHDIGLRAAYESGVQPTALQVEVIAGPDTLREGVERDVVRTRIFADAARAAGMRVSDEYIVEYLRQLGRGYVTVDVVRQILAQMQVGGRPMTDAFILDAMREEILSRNYLASYQFSIDTLMPEQRWKDWLRVNDRIVLEAADIPVESFIVDVPDPTDAELVAFYDQYKNRERLPERAGGLELPSPTPGFSRPRKVDLQYLRADFNTFLEKVEEEVTDAEIEKFYNDNKDTMFVSAASLLDTTTPAEDTESGTADETAPDDGGATESAPADNDQSSTAPRGKESVFRLAAFQDDGDEAADAVTETESTAAAPEETSEVQVSDAFPTDPTDDKPKEYQPLDEVRDEIRRQIAEVKVSEQLEKLVNELEHQLNERYTNYFGAVLDAEAAGQPRPEPPADLADLTADAEAHGLEFHKTGPITFLELREMPVGRSAQPAAGNLPLIASVFGDQMELYQPIVSFDLDGNRYITMKASDTPGDVPALADIRDEVVRAYKMQKAADLALARAKDDARKAQESGVSLEQFFANDSSVKVVKTDPFAMLTIGNISPDTRQVQSFRLSEPDGIVAAGPEAMQAIFALGDGEVGAVLNHDHTRVYVVKIAEHAETEAELRQAFLAEADTWYGIPAMGMEHRQIAIRVLLDDILKSVDLDWKRTPDSVVQEEEVEETEVEEEA